MRINSLNSTKKPVWGRERLMFLLVSVCSEAWKGYLYVRDAAAFPLNKLTIMSILLRLKMPSVALPCQMYNILDGLRFYLARKCFDRFHFSMLTFLYATT